MALANVVYPLIESQQRKKDDDGNSFVKADCSELKCNLIGAASKALIEVFFDWFSQVCELNRRWGTGERSTTFAQFRLLGAELILLNYFFLSFRPEFCYWWPKNLVEPFGNLKNPQLSNKRKSPLSDKNLDGMMEWQDLLRHFGVPSKIYWSWGWILSGFSQDSCTCIFCSSLAIFQCFPHLFEILNCHT